MGYFAQGRCHGDLQEAMDASLANQTSLGVSGGTLHYLDRDGAAVPYWRMHSVDATTGVEVAMPWYIAQWSFPPCDQTAEFEAGVVIGWGVVSAMAAVWAIKFLQRALT